MPSEDNKILEFIQHQKSDKALFITYVNLECFIGKTDNVKINVFPSGFSMYTILSFKNIGNKHDVYGGKNCMNP